MLLFCFILLVFCCFSSVPDVLWDTTWLLINLLSTLFLCSLPLSLHWKELGICIILIIHCATEFPMCFQDLTWEKPGLFLWVNLLQISPFAVKYELFSSTAVKWPTNQICIQWLCRGREDSWIWNTPKNQENQIKNLLSFLKWCLFWVKLPNCQW